MFTPLNTLVVTVGGRSSDLSDVLKGGRDHAACYRTSMTIAEQQQLIRSTRCLDTKESEVSQPVLVDT